MRKKALVIGDIAKELKVSITTISFILNGKAREKRISEDLADRVLKYVKKVNYSPNHLAKSLRTGKTNLIGLIVENISNPFFANMARLIEEKKVVVPASLIVRDSSVRVNKAVHNI